MIRVHIRKKSVPFEMLRHVIWYRNHLFENPELRIKWPECFWLDGRDENNSEGTRGLNKIMACQKA